MSKLYFEGIAFLLIEYCTTINYWTHCGRVTHICVGKLSIISSDNGLSPGRRHAIIWTNAGILLIGPLGTNFSENWIGIATFSIKEMHLKMLSAKWHLFGLGLNVLTNEWDYDMGGGVCNIRYPSYPSDTHIDTLRPRQNGRHFADDIFKCIFLNENVWIPIKILLKFVPKDPINNIPALVQAIIWINDG